MEAWERYLKKQDLIEHSNKINILELLEL